jgi:hypothetical protein
VNPVEAMSAELFGVLDSLGILYVVGGSVASSVWGNPRQTNDLDIAVRIRGEQAEPLVLALGANYVASAEEILRTLSDTEEYRAFQIIHLPTMTKIDAFVPASSVFMDSVFARAQPVDIAPDLKAWCMSREDIVIQKLRWFELGNRVSDRQWNDIVQVLEIQAGRLDEEYLLGWARHFGFEGLLEAAMGQAAG